MIHSSIYADFTLLCCYSVPLLQVAIYFHNKLFRGNRSTKTNTASFEAFQSPNLPPLASVGIDISGVCVMCVCVCVWGGGGGGCGESLVTRLTCVQPKVFTLIDI